MRYWQGRGRTVAVIRTAVGLWLVALAVFIIAEGTWLGSLLLIPAAVHFLLAWRAVRTPPGSSLRGFGG
jgi:hypothetical protein